LLEHQDLLQYSFAVFIIFKVPINKIILMIQNYFDDSKLFSDLYPAKF